MSPTLPLLLFALLAGCAARAGLTEWEAEQLARRERGIATSTSRVFDDALTTRIAGLLGRIEPGLSMRVYVLQDPAPQAGIIGGRVLVVRTGLIEAAPSDDELAFALAHELAHAVLGHMEARRAPGWDAAGAERDADAWALARTRRLGFDTAAAASLLRRLATQLDGVDRASVETRAAVLAQGLAF